MNPNRIKIGKAVFDRIIGDIGLEGYHCRKKVNGEFYDSIVPRPMITLKSRHEPVNPMLDEASERKYLEGYLAGKLDEE